MKTIDDLIYELESDGTLNHIPELVIRAMGGVVAASVGPATDKQRRAALDNLRSALDPRRDCTHSWQLECPSALPPVRPGYELHCRVCGYVIPAPIKGVAR